MFNLNFLNNKTTGTGLGAAKNKLPAQDAGNKLIQDPIKDSKEIVNQALGKSTNNRMQQHIDFVADYMKQHHIDLKRLLPPAANKTTTDTPKKAIDPAPKTNPTDNHTVIENPNPNTNPGGKNIVIENPSPKTDTTDGTRQKVADPGPKTTTTDAAKNPTMPPPRGAGDAIADALNAGQVVKVPGKDDVYMKAKTGLGAIVPLGSGGFGSKIIRPKSNSIPVVFVDKEGNPLPVPEQKTPPVLLPGMVPPPVLDGTGAYDPVSKCTWIPIGGVDYDSIQAKDNRKAYNDGKRGVFFGDPAEWLFPPDKLPAGYTSPQEQIDANKSLFNNMQGMVYRGRQP